MIRQLILAMAVVGWIGRASRGDEAPSNKSTTVDFARDVFPVLQRACLECHGAAKHEGGLRLETGEAAFASVGSGDPCAAVAL
jgi:Planctomycete cytochrome C